MTVDSYRGRCALCGRRQTFRRADRSSRETFRCRSCGASLREREQARAIVSLHPEARSSTFAAFARSAAAAQLDIYEPGTIGPLRAYLGRLPGYRRSDYYADPSEATAELPHESLEALSMPDASLDLVITSDILEHVADPRRAFAEIARVLRIGGHHVCAVPIHFPYDDHSTVRATVGPDGEVVHLLEPAYHGDGKGGRSLVFTDFGLDVLDQLDAVGMDARLEPADAPHPVAHQAATLICTRAR